MKTIPFRKRILAALCCVLILLLSACSAAAPTAQTESTPKPETHLPETFAPAVNRGDEEPADAAPEGAGEGGLHYDTVYGKSTADLSGRAGSPSDGEGAPAATGETSPGTPDETGESGSPWSADPGSALVLTAAEWNDNRNWPFFTNLVQAGTVRFPSFGIDPRNRIAVTVQDEAGTPLRSERVTLTAEDGAVLWKGCTDHEGRAYLFFAEGSVPAAVSCGEVSVPVQQPEQGGDPQGGTVYRQAEELTLTVVPAAGAPTGLQIMFIVDTTGSMCDELAYLQKDFSAIAGRVEGGGVEYCASFYRDEGDLYVTKVGEFTESVKDVQALIAEEYADGGGDEPEAVADILEQCISDFSGWKDDSVKLAFLIFDAPPHEGTDARLQAAVRCAAEKGIRLIPVVASNAQRDTELFGRAIAACTGGTYVFLTDDSGVGESHLEPIVGDYEVKLLQDLIVEIVERYRG